MARSRRFPDEFQNELFKCWHKHRQQALWRGEQYELSVEDFFDFWPKELWDKRGRGRNSLCMIRVNDKVAWSKSNCKIVTRLEQLRKTNKRRFQSGPYFSYKARQ